MVTNGVADDSFPVFEQIIYIICVDTHATLVTEPWDTINYERHTHSYTVQQTVGAAWSIIPINNLRDRQVYHAAASYQAGDPYKHVTMRYRIN